MQGAGFQGAHQARAAPMPAHDQGGRVHAGSARDPQMPPAGRFEAYTAEVELLPPSCLKRAMALPVNRRGRTAVVRDGYNQQGGCDAFPSSHS